MEKMHYTRVDEWTDADFQVLKHFHEETLRLLPDCLFGLLRNLAKDTAYNVKSSSTRRSFPPVEINAFESIASAAATECR